MSTGVCSRTLPLVVLSAGAVAAGSSGLFAYSPSKPTKRMLKPTAKPRVWRFDGVMLAPMKAVASANAGRVHNIAEQTRTAESGFNRTKSILRDMGSGFSRPSTGLRASLSLSKGRTIARGTVPCRMDFRLTDDQELLRRSIREFAETEIRPHIVEWDNAQHFPIELVPKLADLGLMGIQFPEEYGGAGMSAID